MAKEDEGLKNAVTPNLKVSSMPTPNSNNPPNNNNNKDQSPNSGNSQFNSSNPKNGGAIHNITPVINPDEYIFSVAAKIASQPLQHSDPDAWGVLTAISDKARKRHQAMNMLLTADVHCIGRIVEDVRFQIVGPAVSASHCRIYRKVVNIGDADNPASVCTYAFLKDCSTNGTYINSRKLNKSSPEVKLCHGDVISIALAPQHESAYAFVFREVSSSDSSLGSSGLKRKADDPDCENKRLKGIGIGASNGPISLDDFRSLQRSNTELRKQLEEQVAKIDTLRSEHRAATESHENELKVLKESISESYIGQLKEKQELIEAKDKELIDLKRISSEQKNTMDDLNEEITASKQSCVEANEVINSQKASLSELKALLDEEREQRREEREKALVDLKTSVQRIKAELQEEMQRLSDASTRREKEQQEVINKLQDSEKERSSLLETLRAKLEDIRQKLVTSENKVRQLEAQVSEGQSASASKQKRVEELELETKRMRKELQREKAAREEAWAKVSALELEINAAMRDLDFERRRLKGAKERIMLRETQLRAFYSTTEEIQLLCAKQQEQLKAMQRTLEDEEENDDDDMLVDINRHHHHNNIKLPLLQREKSMSRSSTKRHDATDHATDCEHSSGDEASVTRKHDCNAKIDGDDTQEVEFPGPAVAVPGSKDGFGSEVVVVNNAATSASTMHTEPLETDTAGDLVLGDLVATERVLETQIAENEEGIEHLDLNSKPSSFVEDTMQLDEVQPDREEEDTQGGGGESIKTCDLITSEVPGSWACSSAPSAHGENESLGGGGGGGGGSGGGGGGSGGGGGDTADESQCMPSSSAKQRGGTEWNHERRALSEMIGIIAPDLKDQFCEEEGSKVVVVDSGSDTEGCSDNSVVNSDDEHGGGGIFPTKNKNDVEESPQHTMVDDEDDDDTECDSP